jgi:hypothetical protein
MYRYGSVDGMGLNEPKKRDAEIFGDQFADRGDLGQSRTTKQCKSPNSFILIFTIIIMWHSTFLPRWLWPTWTPTWLPAWLVKIWPFIRVERDIEMALFESENERWNEQNDAWQANYADFSNSWEGGRKKPRRE